MTFPFCQAKIIFLKNHITNFLLCAIIKNGFTKLLKLFINTIMKPSEKESMPTKPTPSTVARIYRLRQARKINGMTLREAAKGLGFSYQYLHKIESKGCKMDSEMLLKFSKFYNVTVDYLTGINKPKIVFDRIHFSRIKF